MLFCSMHASKTYSQYLQHVPRWEKIVERTKKKASHWENAHRTEYILNKYVYKQNNRFQVLGCSLVEIQAIEKQEKSRQYKP